MVEQSLQFVEPGLHGGEPAVGLPEIGQALGGVVGPAGGVERLAAGLGLDVGDLPGGAGQRE